MSTRRRVQTNWVHGRTLQTSTEPVIAKFSEPSDFLVEDQVNGLGTVHTPLKLNLSSTWCDIFTLLLTTFCAHRFFYSITASDCSDGTTVSRVVSPRSIVMHHGNRSKKARRERKQNPKHLTPHSWLPAKVIYLANSTMSFSWLTLSTQVYIVEGRWNIYTVNVWRIKRCLLYISVLCIISPVETHSVFTSEILF